MAEFTYEITERIAVLSTNVRGWERQLNLVSCKYRHGIKHTPQYNQRCYQLSHTIYIAQA